MGLFGKSKSPDPKEQVNEWCRKIRKEGNGLERQIRQIQRGEQAAIKYINILLATNCHYFVAQFYPAQS